MYEQPYEWALGIHCFFGLGKESLINVVVGGGD